MTGPPFPHYPATPESIGDTARDLIAAVANAKWVGGGAEVAAAAARPACRVGLD